MGRIGDPLPRKVVVTIWGIAAAGLAVLSSWWAIRGRTPWTMSMISAGVALVEEVLWDELVCIGIVTTSGGPFAEDVFWVLEADGGTGCLVSLGDAVRTGLLPAIQKRFSPVNDQMIVRAMGSTSDASFTVWEKTSSAV